MKPVISRFIYLASLFILTGESALAAFDKSLPDSKRVRSSSCLKLEGGNSDRAQNPCFQHTVAFISGARLVDKYFVSNIKNSNDPADDFMERVYKTRTGSGKVSSVIMDMAPFCIKESATDIEVADNIVNHFTYPIKNIEALNIQIERLLRGLYPCSFNRM